MKIRAKSLIITWMAVFSIVSLLLLVYILHTNDGFNTRVANGILVPTSIRENVEKLSQTVIEAQQRVNTEFISLVNIFQDDGYMPSTYGQSNNKAEITWCSFCDEKHLHYVNKIASFWDGPVSIAVFTYGSKIPYTLKYLSALRHCDAYVRQKVRFHLSIPEAEVGPFVKRLIDDLQTTNLTCEMLQQKLEGAVPNYADQKMPFPNNYLRNVALKNAKTSHVINVDIDYTPSKHLREKFLNFITVSRGTVKPKTAFVLPCFESNITLESPISRDQLLERWNAGTIRQFHVLRCNKCQIRTDYTRWRSLEVAQTHLLSLAYYSKYKGAWEPYFISRKDQLPEFDERFRGYGFNRVSQVCEMYMRGFEFAVVDDGFLVHDGHEGAKRTELIKLKMKSHAKNHKLYGNMIRELQKRYPNKSSNTCQMQ